jgi:hypothetical protein
MDSDDRNLSLPSYFITCFGYHQMEDYKEAIRRYEKIDRDHDLVIDTSGRWNRSGDPALLCHKRTDFSLDLTPFWRIYEEVTKTSTVE